MKNWLNLNHKLYKSIKENNIESKRFLIAFSGGMDSLVLAHCFVQILSQHKHQLGFFYYHHGDLENKNYRDQAQLFCQKFAQEQGVEFFSGKNQELHTLSEAEMRDKRYHAIENLAHNHKFDFIVTAHHLEDLLETRMLRLIRGVGIQGIEAIKTLDRNRFRPFLKTSKAELMSYAQSFNLLPAEDPTNLDSVYLRNWLRNEWLPMLEKKQKGSVERLARSLDQILEALQDSALLEKKDFSHGISRAYFLTLSSVAKKQEIASYLHWLGKKDFTQGQIEEIVKYLDKNQIEYKFKVADCEWKINAEQIWV